MASKQSNAVTKLYQTWLGDPDEGEVIRDQTQWDVLTVEPGGVDYLEPDLGEVPALWVVPRGSAEDRVLLCIHGGGFVSGSVYTHRKLFAHLAKATGARALVVGYPLIADGGQFPVPVEHVLTAYRWLLDQGVQAEHVAFAGDSAGGSLAVTAQVHARLRDLPLPAATVLLSPWIDLEVTGETMVSNADTEALFTQSWVAQMAQGYLGTTGPRDPLANPLFADLSGFGPMYLQVGGYEVLLDDSRRLAEHAGQAGVEVELDVVPEMQHTFQMMAGRAPEADDAIRRLATWLRPVLGLVPDEPPWPTKTTEPRGTKDADAVLFVASEYSP
ncbi:MAG: epsilon-lactone hydrolase [Actinomycetota bacterium]|jgi:acetyl esterase/lipase|nr:epsilon-lactone hydrolase [Actinomycetota bacterium]